MSHQELWSLALEFLEEALGADGATFNAIIPQLSPKEPDREVDYDVELAEFELIAPNDFLRRTVTEKHLPALERCIRKASRLDCDFNVTISVGVQTSLSLEDIESPGSPAHSVPRRIAHQEPSADRYAQIAMPSMTPIPPFDRHRLGNVIIHPGNLDAAHNAYLVATKTGVRIPCFAIYGASGSGKTAHLDAIAQLRKQYHPEDQIVRILGEGFVNEVINGVLHNTMAKVRDSYRGQGKLCLVDDAHQILEMSPVATEEFFNTLKALELRDDVNVVLAFESRPGSYAQGDSQLQFRLEGGVVEGLHLPEPDILCQMVQSWFEQQEVVVSEEVVRAMVDVVKNNPKVLWGAHLKICSHLSLHGPVRVENVEAILGDDYTRNNIGQVVTLQQIAEYVAGKHSLSATDLCGPKRGGGFDSPRQYACYLMREMTDKTWKVIGEFMNNRNHATIKHAHDQIADQIDDGDASLKQLMEEYQAEIRG